MCRTPARTAADIRAAAKEAASLAVRGEPVNGGPYTVAVEFDAEHLAAASTVVPGVERVGERKVAYTTGTMYEGIRTFKAVTTIASAAVEEQYG